MSTDYREFGRAEPLLREVVAHVCGYEYMALKVFPGRLPTVTRLCRQHPVIALLVLIGLGRHFAFKPAPLEVSP